VHLKDHSCPWKTSAKATDFKHPFRFLWRILQRFQANQGLLLSGAVAYYTLLSIILCFILRSSVCPMWWTSAGADHPDTLSGLAGAQ